MGDDISIGKLAKQVQSEADAYVYLERLRWNGTPLCPHCDGTERVVFLKPANGTSRKTRTGSLSERRVWFCGRCRKQFSVLTGTVMHGTKISVHTWLFVMFEMCASKNGVSAREIERKYQLTGKTAWFLLHRIREAMKAGPLADMMRGSVVADETFIGGKERNKHKTARRSPGITPTTEPVQIVPGQRQKRHGGGAYGKTPVLTLVNRETGEARSRVIPDVTGATLRKAIAEQVDMAATTLITDESKGYIVLGREMAAHKTVNHSEDEYVRYEAGEVITSNQAENFFSQLKRSVDGTHHHVSAFHLPRYLAEFDFRYSTRKLSDTARMRLLMTRVANRRLTYSVSLG